MSKSLPWFRMYADFLNDPKLIALAFEDQRHFIGVLAACLRAGIKVPKQYLVLAEAEERAA